MEPMDRRGVFFVRTITISRSPWPVTGTHLARGKEREKKMKGMEISDGSMHMIRHRENGGEKRKDRKKNHH